MREFLTKLRLSASLRELGVDRSQLSELAAGVAGNLANDPAAQEENIILKIYERAWEEL